MKVKIIRTLYKKGKMGEVMFVNEDKENIDIVLYVWINSKDKNEN